MTVLGLPAALDNDVGMTFKERNQLLGGRNLLLPQYPSTWSRILLRGVKSRSNSAHKRYAAIISSRSALAGFSAGMRLHSIALHLRRQSQELPDRPGLQSFLACQTLSAALTVQASRPYCCQNHQPETPPSPRPEPWHHGYPFRFSNVGSSQANHQKAESANPESNYREKCNILIILLIFYFSFMSVPPSSRPHVHNLKHVGPATGPLRLFYSMRKRRSSS